MWKQSHCEVEQINPNRSLDRYRAICYREDNFQPSSIFLLASCFLFVLDVTRYAFELTTNNLFNNPMKSVQDLMTDLGLTKKLHQPVSWCSVYAGSANCTRKEQVYFLSQLFLSPQPCSPQQPFFSLHSFLQSFMQPFLQDFLSSFLQHFLSSFLQHFLLSFLQQDSFLSACFTSCAAALRPKVSKATNAKHLATEFALNSCILFVF